MRMCGVIESVYRTQTIHESDRVPLAIKRPAARGETQTPMRVI